jgi:hypothetical protein
VEAAEARRATLARARTLVSTGFLIEPSLGQRLSVGAKDGLGVGPAADGFLQHTDITDRGQSTPGTLESESEHRYAIDLEENTFVFGEVDQLTVARTLWARSSCGFRERLRRLKEELTRFIEE